MANAPSILLVEDEPALMDALERIIAAQGWKVAATVATVSAGIEFVSNRDCDAAIVDANLRGQCSKELVTELLRRKIPLVVVSGYNASNRGGLWDEVTCILKPFDESELISVVSNLLKQNMQ